MSVRASTLVPRACSGDIYYAVPITIPSSVFTIVDASGSLVGRELSFASPKSTTFTIPSRRSMMFSGFMSR